MMAGKVVKLWDNLVNVGEHVASCKSEARRIGAKFYFTGKPCPHGHVCLRYHTGGCVECMKAYGASAKAKACTKAWSASNKEYVRRKHHDRYVANCDDAKAKQRAWHAENRDVANAESRAWHEANRDDANAKRAKWRSEHPEHTKRKMKAYYGANKGKWYESNKRRRKEKPDEVNALARKWYQDHKGEPKFKAKIFIKESLRRTLKGVQCESDKCIGYQWGQLVRHLESKFDAVMNWENYGSYWHIDHIIPISYFLEKGIEDPSIVNALWNLRPLEASENMSKGAKVSYALMQKIKDDAGVDVRVVIAEACNA